MRSNVRHRYTVKEDDLYRQPNVQSAVVSQGEAVEEKVRKLVERGYLRELPLEQRADRIASGLFRTRNRDLDNVPRPTSRYTGFLQMVMALLEKYEGGH